MTTSHVMGTRRHGKQLSKGDIVVIERSVAGGEPTLIKLKGVANTNALGWAVWEFTTVCGVPKFKEFSVAGDLDVELCMPLVDVEKDDVGVKLPFVFRPYHVYVEESAGTSVYNVYKFTRNALAKDVMFCAKRFGLQSFIVPVFSPVIVE